MSPEVSDLLKRALALPDDERAALANMLLDSLEMRDESIQEACDMLANMLLDSLEMRDESIQEACDKEVARRMKDLKDGKAVTVPWEQLHRELLAFVNER